MFKVTISVDPIQLQLIQSWCTKTFGIKSVSYKVIISTIVDVNGYREYDCEIVFDHEKYISAFMLVWGEEIDFVSLS